MSKLTFLLEKLKILNLKYEKLNENNSDKNMRLFLTYSFKK